MAVCRQMIAQQELSTLNMREVAARCQVALGSIYNYFPSKNELLIAAIASVWQDILWMGQDEEQGGSFPEYVQWLFQRVKSGTERYPRFFASHSILFAAQEKQGARHAMDAYFTHMKKELLDHLNKDPAVRANAFSQEFRPEEFVEFVLSNLLALLTRQEQDCHVLLEVIRRTL